MVWVSQWLHCGNPDRKDKVNEQKYKKLADSKGKIGVEQFRVIAELLNQEHLTFGDYTRGGFISKEEQREAIMKDFYHGYSWDELERKYGLTPSALYKITEKKT